MNISKNYSQESSLRLSYFFLTRAKVLLITTFNPHIMCTVGHMRIFCLKPPSGEVCLFPGDNFKLDLICQTVKQQSIGRAWLMGGKSQKMISLSSFVAFRIFLALAKATVPSQPTHPAKYLHQLQMVLINMVMGCVKYIN